MRTTLSACALANLAAAAAVTAQTPAQGGVLTDDFNRVSNAQKDMVRGTMFELLWNHNVMARETHFRLAESFEYAEDLSSMTIRLGEGLICSDDTALTAEDRAFALALGRDEVALDKTGK